MERTTRTVLSAMGLAILFFAASLLQAGGWDNWKLRYSFLRKYLYAQGQELEDISPNLDPAKSSRIDLSQLLAGGPPKDGIPSTDNPQFDNAQTTPFAEDETVIGVVVAGEAKAYPLGIMNWHEIVNDSLGGSNITVSYCPLCDTIVAFNRGNTTYGVSGKLYQSCLVMYDRGDDTLYSQPWAMGVVGPKVNQALERLPAIKTTLGAWLAKHPQSQILSTRTGYTRNYQRYPYGSYYTDRQIIFPVRNQGDRQLHPKAIVSYVWEPDAATPANRFSGASQQFVHQELAGSSEERLQFGERQIHARWDPQLETVVVTELDGTPIPSSTAFAFVYPAFFEE